MTTKLCPNCQEILPMSSFGFRDRHRTKIQSYCRDCANAAWRRWYSTPGNKEHHLEVLRRRRARRIRENRAIVRALKRRPCGDCGHQYPPEVMDFDHLHSKEALISKLVYASGRERLINELLKCDIVCANCHRVRTSKRLGRGGG